MSESSEKSIPRELAPDECAVKALRFIKEFNLGADQVLYRYTVPQIDKMCFEMGLKSIECELEQGKVKRLLLAICTETIIKDFRDPSDKKLGSVDAHVAAYRKTLLAKERDRQYAEKQLKK